MDDRIGYDLGDRKRHVVRVGHRMLAGVGANGTTNGADAVSAGPKTKREGLGRHLRAFPSIAFAQPGTRGNQTQPDAKLERGCQRTPCTL
jgi:hypothetical protein